MAVETQSLIKRREIGTNGDQIMFSEYKLYGDYVPNRVTNASIRPNFTCSAHEQLRLSLHLNTWVNRWKIIYNNFDKVFHQAKHSARSLSNVTVSSFFSLLYHSQLNSFRFWTVDLTKAIWRRQTGLLEIVMGSFHLFPHICMIEILINNENNH